MKAIVFDRHGGPEVLKYSEVPEPQLGARDVLVRVRACALNHLDLWVRGGLPGVAIPLPHIPGSDISGEVAKVGAEVKRVSVGQKVLLAPGVSCGRCAACLAGEDNKCPEFSNLGYIHDGGCAEFVRCPEVNCFAYPEKLSFEEAAAVPLVFQTAWHMLIGRAELQPGEEVLVLGAGSGVGSAAIQIAKFFGCRVIATAGSEEKLAKAKELGADETIHHHREKIREAVRKFTGKRGVDVVFEHVGTATWDDSVASLARGGRLVTCGATTGFDAKIDLRFLFSRQLSILGSYMGTKDEFATVLKLVASGKLKPVVDKILALAECRAAHEYLESGAQFGKVVLKV
ncbi:MAG TPA: zinc-binding dehydrogenase [Candidatus Sulfotelmatobacter sp.]|jgi:NADPH:quinone reductase-like Zn-dependent oxidoreductase|nr:zinc-binding dehydrogenase [Candidatus Sulfotelmatobacter sp.]